MTTLSAEGPGACRCRAVRRVVSKALTPRGLGFVSDATPTFPITVDHTGHRALPHGATPCGANANGENRDPDLAKAEARAQSNRVRGSPAASPSVGPP
eukprot:6109574-Prymnesium_polylepis.2